MTVSYENTSDDAVAWTTAYLTRTLPGRTARRRMRIFSAFLLVLVSLLDYVLICSLLDWPVSPAPMILVTLAAAFAAYLLTLRPKAREMTKKMMKSGHFDQLLGHKRVTVAPEGLHTVWEGGEVLRKWSSLKRIEESDTHLYFFYLEVEFGVLPKRAFRNETEQRTFLAIVERYRSGGALAAAVVAAPAAAPSLSTTALPASTAHAPGSPWWRNRSAVDTETQPIQHRSG